jgi:hypothetical protein
MTEFVQAPQGDAALPMGKLQDATFCSNLRLDKKANY